MTSTTLQLRNTTRAPRSAVVHALALPSATYRGHVTECGRRIGDEWAGEYTETPVGGVSCTRCLPAVLEADHAEALEENTRRAAAVFSVGDRVAVMGGVQSAHGRYVVTYGDVVSIMTAWSGPVEYVVTTASGERLVFPAYLLTSVPVDLEAAHGEALEAYTAATGRVIGQRDGARMTARRTSSEELHALADIVERVQVEAAHAEALEEWATRGTVSEFRVCFTKNGWDGPGMGLTMATCLTSDGYSSPDGFAVMLGILHGPVTVHAYALVNVNGHAVPFRGLVMVGEQPAGCAECSATLPADGVCRVCDGPSDFYADHTCAGCGLPMALNDYGRWVTEDGTVRCGPYAVHGLDLD